MARVVKLPAWEFVALLRKIAFEVEQWENLDGEKTGWDKRTDSRYNGLHRCLLNWKRKKAKEELAKAKATVPAVS